MISRAQALEFLNEKIENKNIIKHMLATESLMGGVYDYLISQGREVEGSKDEWMMAGLLHDGDYIDGVSQNLQGIQITNWLNEKGFEIPQNVAHAMAAHNWTGTGVEPKNLMDWTIYSGDSLTGLITASCLVLSSKKLSDLSTTSILKRFKEPKFAARTRREDIARCEEKLGISLEKFVEISLSSMQKISDSLGL